VVLLAAVAYGEASAGDVYEEMAAIASVVVRQRTARGSTLQDLLGAGGTFAFAASDGNPARRRSATPGPPTGSRTPGWQARSRPPATPSTAATTSPAAPISWDGADIKTNYANHPKVKLGIKFTRPEHNIYKIKATSVDITTHWQIKDKDGKTVDGKVRGHYTHVYESTAAYGGTIFWKYNADFLKATGNKEYN
jgi:transcription elongation factor